MNLDLDHIKKRYAALDEETLRRDLLQGPQGYSSPEVWTIITEEARSRGFAEAEIPSDASDPLIAAASFVPNIEIVEGPFDSLAQIRGDGVLVVIAGDNDLAPLRDRLEQVAFPASLRGFEVTRHGVGSLGRSVTTRILGGGLIGGLLAGSLLNKTKAELSTFRVTLTDGRIFTARAQADLVTALAKRWEQRSA